MSRNLPGTTAGRIAAALMCVAWSTCGQAEIAIHAGPLSTVAGTGDRVECAVVNVDTKPVYDVRLTLRSTNFGTVLAQASCPQLLPGADCPVSFNVAGPALVVRIACSAEAGGKKDALRGTFLRTSTIDNTGDVAVELR
ncbi:MAG: hypothetical protein U1F58_18460 [Burkholderiales bacterium]